MIFQDTYITDAGQALLTRAVAGTQIIWGTCGCFAHAGINDLSDSQVNALTSLNNPCALGQASSVFNGSSNTARIDCQCSNSETGCTAGQALAFGLWAKLQGDASEVLVAIARTGTYTPTTFPTYDGTPQTKLIGVVDLTISINPGVASTITINPSVFALANDLQDAIEALEDIQGRAVTTHASGTPGVGEYQEIYGRKDFNDGITVEKEYSNEVGNYYGTVHLVASTMNADGGTYPHARFTVSDSSVGSDIGIWVNRVKTYVVGPFEVNDVSIPYGLAPTISNDVPVLSKGNILMIGIKRISSGGSTPMPINKQTGDVIQDGQDVYVYAVNSFGGDWVLDEYVRYTGEKFRLMSGGEIGVGNTVFALAMVVE